MMSDSEQLWPAAPPREGFLLLYQLLYIFIHICAPDGNSYIHTCDIFLVVKKWKRSSTQYSFFFLLPWQQFCEEYVCWNFAFSICFMVCLLDCAERGKKKNTCRGGSRAQSSVWGGAGLISASITVCRSSFKVAETFIFILILPITQFSLTVITN